MCLKKSGYKRTELNSSVNDHQDTFKTYSLKPLAKVVWGAFDHISFLSVKANESWCVPDKDVTAKYVINARCSVFLVTAHQRSKKWREALMYSMWFKCKEIMKVWGMFSVFRITMRRALWPFSVSDGGSNLKSEHEWSARHLGESW